MTIPAPAGTSTLTGAFGTDIPVPVPASVAAGDVLVLGVYHESGGTVTWPAGFTSVGSQVVASDHRMDVAVKRATAADSGTYTVTYDNPGSWWRSGGCLRITGAIASGAIAEASVGTATGTGGTTPAVSNTTTTIDTLQVWWATNFNGGAWTPPSGYTEQIDFGGALSAATLGQAAVGGSGSITGSCAGGAVTSTALLVAIRSTDSAGAVVDQHSFAWGDDNGSESTHTIGTVGADLTAPLNESHILRVLLDGTDDPAALSPELWAQKNGAGGYSKVNVGGSSTPTITHGAIGTVGVSASGGTTVSPAYPAGITADSELILVIGQKPSTANGGTATTPTGWTLRDSLTAAGGYGTTLGADTGNTNIYVYSKDDVTGSESGTLAVTVGTNGVCWAYILRAEVAGGPYTISFASGTGSDTTAGNVSIATSAGVDITAGDLIYAGMVIPTDVTTPAQFSAEALAQTGTTFGTVTELAEPDSTVGNDIGGVLVAAPVSSGGGTGAVTFTATAAGTTTNVRGPGFVLRLRATGITNEIYVAPSTGITNGAATTARLTPPSGKTTGDFDAGVIFDTANGGTSVDIGLDGYTEAAWVLQAQAPAATDDLWDFEVRGASGAALSGTVIDRPRWTIGGGVAELATASTSGLTGSATATAIVELAASSSSGLTATATGALTPAELTATTTSGLTASATGAAVPELAATTTAALTATATAAAVLELATATPSSVTATATGAAVAELAATGAAALTATATAGATVDLDATTSSGLTATATAAVIVELAATSTSGLTATATGSSGVSGDFAVLGTFTPSTADPHNLTISGATAGRDIWLLVNCPAVVTTPSGWTSEASRVATMASYVYRLPGGSNPGGSVNVSLDLSAGRALAAVAIEATEAATGTVYASLVVPVNGPGSTAWGTGAHTFTTRATAFALYYFHDPTAPPETFAASSYDSGFTALADTGWAGTAGASDEAVRILVAQADGAAFTAGGVSLTLDAAGPTGSAVGFLAFDYAEAAIELATSSPSGLTATATATVTEVALAATSSSSLTATATAATTAELATTTSSGLTATATAGTAPIELAATSASGLTSTGTGAAVAELAGTSTAGLTGSATGAAVADLAAASSSGLTATAVAGAVVVIPVDPAVEVVDVADIAVVASTVAELAATTSASLTATATAATVAELTATTSSGLTATGTAGTAPVELAAAALAGLTAVMTAAVIVELAATTSSGLTATATAGADVVALAATTSAGLTGSATAAVVAELAAVRTSGLTGTASASVTAELAAVSVASLTARVVVATAWLWLIRRGGSNHPATPTINGQPVTTDVVP